MRELKPAGKTWNNFLDRVQLSSQSKARGLIGSVRVRLYCYHLPVETFACLDECAGYYVSRAPVLPAGVSIIDDVIGELLRIGVELRFVPNLWPLRDAVASSTLQFSIIRMHNAQPR